MAFGKNQGMVFFSGNPCGAFFAFLMLGVVLLAGEFLSKFWLSGGDTGNWRNIRIHLFPDSLRKSGIRTRRCAAGGMIIKIICSL